MNWTISRADTNCLTLEWDVSGSGDSREILLMSDEHVDNAECHLPTLIAHHERAIEIGAPICKFGDTFCLMQGKWDKRADQNQLLPELRGNNYLDNVESYAFSKYEKYARNIAALTKGNHCISIENRHQTSLIERLASRLRQAGSPVLTAGVAGFVRLSFRWGSRSVASKLLCYHHGYGGGGEVTRGMIDNNRTRGQYLADVYYSGHIHRRNMDENVLLSVNRGGKVTRMPQLFLRGSSYKIEEFSEWHTSGGRAARPIGGWWLKLTLSRKGDSDELLMEARPA